MLSFLSLLIVSAVAAAPTGQRYPDAVEIYACGFERDTDPDYDGWPVEWSRRRGPGYPYYLSARIRHEPAPQGEQCFRLEVDGGAVAVQSPTIEIDPRFNYVVEVFVRTEKLVHDRAFATLTFLDEERRTLDRYTSQRLVDVPGWRKLRLGPVTSKHATARYATIGLHLEPGARADLRGAACFDDVWLGRLPRLAVTVDEQRHVINVGQKVGIRCRVSGLSSADARLLLEVENAFGQSLPDAARRFARQPTPPGPFAEQAWQWDTASLEPGYYRVRVMLAGSEGFWHTADLPLAVIEPRERPPVGEFGWSLPQCEQPLGWSPTARLLKQAAVSRVKLPMWLDAHDKQRIGDLVTWADRLRGDGIGIVGVLAEPPAAVCKQLGLPERLTAIEFLQLPIEAWYPSLEPVLARMSLLVQAWQLGDDRDTTLANRAELVEKVRQVKQQMERVAQDVAVGVGWNWQVELPKVVPAPWRFVTMSANPPLAPTELAECLADPAPAKTQRWVQIEPLPGEQYTLEDRVVDLVEQMVTAKVHAAQSIFVAEPIGGTNALVLEDGSPGELLLPWRTAALELSGAEYLGRMPLPGGSHNELFVRGDQGVLVVWNDRPQREVVYLGDDVRQIDVWGRRLTPAREGRKQIIEVGPVPTFVDGVNSAVARWQMNVRLMESQMPSILGVKHKNAVRVRNTFDRDIAGTLSVVGPQGWRTSPPLFKLQLAAGEEVEYPFEWSVPLSATTGHQTVRFDFQVNSDEHFDFSVYGQVTLGESDLRLELATRLNSAGELEVEQRLVNDTNQPVSLRFDLYAPGQRRQRQQVLNLARGEDERVYRLPDGAKLLGQTLWIRAEELGGPRVLSYRFVAGEE